VADPTEKTEVISGDPRAAPRIGRYRLERRLGAGGMAEVFLARSESDAGPHGKFEKLVVIKRIRPQLVAQERFVEMFLREGRLLASLDHPNIVRIIELDEDRGEYFLALEYLEGLSLREVAERHWTAGKPLPIEAIINIVADAALGLEYAHTWNNAKIIHRDVSPDNLFVTTSGTTKVIDFGIAKRQGGEQLTHHGELKGKVPFMAPEQLQGAALDSRADLFALGVVLYWLFTGRRPFDGASDVHTMKAILEDPPRAPRLWNPKLPKLLEDIVMSLLEKDRDKRMQSAAVLHDALMTLVVGMPPGAPQPADLVSFAMTIPSSEHEVVPAGLAAAPALPWPERGTAAATYDDNEDIGLQKTYAGLPAPRTRQVKKASDTEERSSDFDPRTEVIKQPNPVDTSTDESKRATLSSSDDPVLDVERIPADSGIDAQPTQLGLPRPPGSIPPQAGDVITDRTDAQAPVPVSSLPSPLPTPGPLVDLFRPIGTDPLAPTAEQPAPAAAIFDASPTGSGTGNTAELLPAQRSRAGALVGALVGLSAVAFAGAWIGGFGPFRAHGLLGDDAGVAASVPVVALVVDAGTLTPLTVVDAGVAVPVVVDAGAGNADDAGDVVEAPVDDDAGPASPSTPSSHPSTRRVTLMAPATVEWIGPNGENLGVGTRTVRMAEGARTVTAVDTKRGGRTRVAIEAHTTKVEYAKLPHQQLQVRARPFAEVFLGKERLGITPLEPVDVVAGSYELRFVYKKTTRVEHVDVKPNKPAAVNVVMAHTSP
jgi:serine/threonine-protein kinase